MVIDTSAVIAILRLETEAVAFTNAIGLDGRRLMSAATLVEATMVAEGDRGASGVDRVDQFIAEFGIEIIPVDREQAEIARRAFRRWGRGRNRAGLNFGDCFAYALARQRGERLLYKGEDFGRTGVESAV